MRLRSKCVLIGQTFMAADLCIAQGKIESICEYGTQKGCIDLGELYILPGMIDLHSDALEKEIEPRPNALFPLEFAIKNLDKKLALAGITTMYHAIAFEENPSKQRHAKFAKEQIEEIIRLRDVLLVDNRIHARFEISSTESLDDLYSCIDRNMIDILSLMDHTPGQGQFKNKQEIINYYRKHNGMSQEDVEALLEKRECKKDIQALKELIEYAKKRHITILSHDDDSSNKLDMLRHWGVQIAEFPLSLEIAQYALSCGLITGMGAPNVVRGGSQSGNVAAMDLIKEGACSYLCSDYHPSSMLVAISKITRTYPHIPFAKAYEMVSKTPAQYVGLEAGEIKEGAWADLIVVKDDEIPELLWCMRHGKNIYHALDINVDKVAC